MLVCKGHRVFLAPVDSKQYLYSVFIEAKQERELKCPLVVEWINKIWFIHACKHVYTHTRGWDKRKDILAYVAAWIDLGTLCHVK